MIEMNGSMESIDYLERAEMHEQLAAATSDVPARKMHQAMAAEYRRKAQAVSVSQQPPVIKIEAGMLIS
jgi:hypothetical protein